MGVEGEDKHYAQDECEAENQLPFYHFPSKTPKCRVLKR